MNITYAWTPYFTDTGAGGREIVGGFLHDTESHAKVDPRAEGSFAFEIDRDGTIYQFVDLADIAWHVRACDRHWPSWLPTWGDYDLSRANEWTVGIELVSDASYRDAGEPYADAQYAALRDLIPWIEGQVGHPLWWDGHGRVQADRSDPVAFDWGQAGLALEGGESFRFQQPVESAPPANEEEDEDPAVIAQLQADIATWQAEFNRVVGENGAQKAVIADYEQTVAQVRAVGAELRDAKTMTTKRRKAIGAGLAAL